MDLIEASTRLAHFLVEKETETGKSYWFEFDSDGGLELVTYDPDEKKNIVVLECISIEQFLKENTL